MERATESRDPNNASFERLPMRDMLAALAAGQTRAIEAVEQAIPALGAAVEAAAERLAEGSGRIAYCGAGTSGRLAVLDGVELTPTFGWPKERLVFLLAGGSEAIVGAVEGAEDDAAAGAADVAEASLGAQDVFVAVAASGTTPYTCAAKRAAAASGAMTIAISSNRDAPLLADAAFPVLIETGAEVLAGSTRLAAGTAQKAALNLFSTSLMARLCKIHDGYMVDMLPTNAKLRQRAVRMVSQITGVHAQPAENALAAANDSIKAAVLVAMGLSPQAAEACLAKHGGDLGAALSSLDGA